MHTFIMQNAEGLCRYFTLVFCEGVDLPYSLQIVQAVAKDATYLQSVWRVSNIYALHRVYALAVYCVVAVIFRHHLFVWSVFSPKMLYDFVATVFTVQALATIAEIIVLTNLTSWLARIFIYKST